MSEHAEAGKASSLEHGGYQPLQIGEEDNESPQRTRIPNNNVPDSANNDVRTTIESPSVGMGKRRSKEENLFSSRTEPSQEYLRAKATVESFFESIPFVLLMAAMTIWALYNDDLRQAFTNKESDDGFEVAITIAFFLFLLELQASCFYKEGYLNLPVWEPLSGETTMQTWKRRAIFGSFYFWLDIIATLSLVLEMKWMLGSNSFNAVNGGGTVQSAKTTQAAQSATRAGRVVRLVRMVRLVRLVKLYKYASMLTGKPPTERVEEEELKESRVGSAMTDLTNRRVIILILIMLIIIPLLTFSDDDISQSLATQFIGQMAQLASLDPSYQTGLDLAVRKTMADLPILFISFNSKQYFKDAKIDSRRAVELNAYEVVYEDFTTLTYFDDIDNSRQDALFSLYTTSFIIVLLMLGTYFFSSDVNKLVIGPIERLVDLVQKISANPLGVEYKAMGAEEGFVAGMETTMLLTTIMKIGGLMRVGFGEAGASVIAKNLSESSGGSLNLLGGGTLIKSIFGFCDVRQFTDTTECLQEEVMLFVNRIAHILHNIVVQCSGSANKNIGDAFLLTWKLDANLTPEQTADLADQALLAFVKALIELGRYQNFICNFSVAATARLYKRFPEYNVRIGSGLHMGWAIEGAIGSNRKIDASYLSPHVNTTEFLESSTKAYGVALLFSEPFFRLLSAEASKYCRQVDRLRRANDEVMSIYTYDADLTIDWNDPYRNNKKKLLNMTAGANPSAVNANAAAQAAAVGRKRLASVVSQNLLNPISENAPAPAPALMRSAGNVANTSPRGKTNVQKRSPSLSLAAEEKDAEAGDASIYTGKESPTIVVAKYKRTVWIKDQDVVDIRHLVSDSFRTKWEVGIAAYVRGDWAKAKEVFQETLALGRNKDGPSKFLLSVIDEHHGEAPADWPGYRDEGGGH